MSEKLNDLRFAFYVFEWLKESHSFFRYSILTAGDYEPYIHQAEIYYRLLGRDPVRFLIADDVGLGKTIEAIMIIDRIVKLRGAKRILLVLPKVLLEQWKYELNRFAKEWGLPVREYQRGSSIDSEGIYMVSVDMFKRNDHYEKISKNSWDLIVVDEIHKVGVTSGKETQRYSSLARLVGSIPKAHFLGLSATPHKGNDEDYKKRLNLIDPYLVELGDSLARYTVRAVVLKRTKDNVNEIYEEDQIFPKAYFVQYVVEPSEEEGKYYNVIQKLTLSILKDYYNEKGEPPKTLPLLSFMIGRRALSSPHAGLLTFTRMMVKRNAEFESSEEVIEEAEEFAESEEAEEAVEPDAIAERLAQLNAAFLEKYKEFINNDLVQLAKNVMQSDSRIRELVELVKNHFGKGDKVVVFTEYKDTAQYIYQKLKDILNLEEDKVKLVTSETLPKEGIESVKKWLSSEGHKVLVATDVASEGLNLQSANVLIHYELPLSIVRFEQRNGRIWRLKQNKPVFIYYLSLNTPIEQEILENYYNRLLSVTRGTGAAVSVADAMVYKGPGGPQVFDLSEEKEGIPIYLTYEDPANKREEKITPLKVWEAALMGTMGDVVELMLRRIRVLKDSMKRFALYESMKGLVLLEIGKVRELSGLNNRREMKATMESFTNKLVEFLGGRVEGKKIFVLNKIHDYDPSKLGDAVFTLYSVLRSPPARFAVCDAFSENYYLVTARLSLSGLPVIEIPLVVSSSGQTVPLSKFIEEVLPLTFSFRKAYPDQRDVILPENWPNKEGVRREVLDKVFALENALKSYRDEGIKTRQRKKDSWLPEKMEDFKVSLEIVGGILGVKGRSEDVKERALDLLKQGGWSASVQGDELRIERGGDVRNVSIVKPEELLEGSGWRYSVVNGVLVGVDHGI